MMALGNLNQEGMGMYSMAMQITKIRGVKTFCLDQYWAMTQPRMAGRQKSKALMTKGGRTSRM